MAKEQARQEARTRAEQASERVERRNAELEQQIQELSTLLTATLDVDDFIDLDTLKDSSPPPAFDPGELGVPLSPPVLQLPPEPTGLARLKPGAKARHEQAVRSAEETHEHQLRAYEEAEAARVSELEKLKTLHKKEVRSFEKGVKAQHKEIEDLKSRFKKNDPSAIVFYFSKVLEASSYPQNFPRFHRVAFSPESAQLLIEYQLPGFDVVPEVKAYRYMKTKNEETTSPRPISQRKALYSSVVAQIAVRTIHEVFEADRDEKVDTVVFNGYVDTVNKSTGKPVRPHLVTVRTTRDTFLSIDLTKVDPEACLKGLKAGLSRNPAELAPVRPVVDFNMVDPRFIEEADVLSELDSRPNLMELLPTEFESLITNLFERMGLETKATRPSRDGGVDCVAWDARPIFGGKVVIQAKRYKNTVGVAAVRDLFGTLHNEGANKGILVTTSGYGKASFDFCEGKPIELLDGGNLLYLLKEHANIDARIEPPEDWVDPSPEMIESS